MPVGNGNGKGAVRGISGGSETTWAARQRISRVCLRAVADSQTDRCVCRVCSSIKAGDQMLYSSGMPRPDLSSSLPCCSGPFFAKGDDLRVPADWGEESQVVTGCQWAYCLCLPRCAWLKSLKPETKLLASRGAPKSRVLESNAAAAAFCRAGSLGWTHSYYHSAIDWLDNSHWL